MGRLVLLAITICSVGCLNLDWLKQSQGVVQSPVNAATVPDSTVVLAAHMSDVGQTLLTASPFLGIAPNFYVLSTEVRTIGHPDAYGVFVSVPLIQQCITKEDLATILALELGTMIIEQRNLARLGLPDPTATLIAGDDTTLNPTQDPNALVVSKVVVKEDTSKREAKTSVDVAKELLTAGGFGTTKVEDWHAALLKVKAAADPSRTLGGPAIAPTWSR